MNKHNCRVCGFFIDNLPWGENGMCPTYEICPCCGVEFGNEDYTLESIREYREKWLIKGAKWFDKAQKPEDWSKEKQFENIPKDFR